MRAFVVWTVLGMCGVLAMSGCSGQKAAKADSETVNVFVSIQPQAYLVEKILGPHGTVSVLVAPGQGPHNYEPTLKQMTNLADADVLFTLGVPFEQRLMEKIHSTMPALRVVDVAAGLRTRVMERHAHDHPDEPEPHDEHTHHDEHDHAEHAHDDTPDSRPATSQPDTEGNDPHTWLNPRLAMTMAERMCQTLETIDPAHQEDYRANLRTLLDDLAALDERLTEAMAPLRGQTMLVFHPAFGYFAEAYGLRQEAVEVEGKSPSARQLADLIEEAKRDNVHVIFVQPQFSQTAANRIAQEIGGAVIPLDPLAREYISNLESIGEAVRDAMVR